MGAGPSLPCPSGSGPLVTFPPECFCRSITVFHVFTADRLARPVCDRMWGFLRPPLLYYAVSGIEPTALAVLGRTPAELDH